MTSLMILLGVDAPVVTAIVKSVCGNHFFDSAKTEFRNDTSDDTPLLVPWGSLTGYTSSKGLRYRV